MFKDGIFGGIFDLDGDGKLDSFEQGLEFMTISELLKEDENSDRDFLSDDYGLLIVQYKKPRINPGF